MYISSYSTAAITHIQYRCMRGVHYLHLVYSSLVCSRRVMYWSNCSESSISKQFSHIYLDFYNIKGEFDMRDAILVIFYECGIHIFGECIRV